MNPAYDVVMQQAQLLANFAASLDADALRDAILAHRRSHAARELHPDGNGTVEAFQQLQVARRILSAHHGEA